MTSKNAHRTRVSAGERRKQIVDRATQLFSHHGFGGVTMAMLATECGVTEPALYR
ncbi:MAG: TetR family transcriptional regulator, partial [candidate division Zixibacteria bacterium]|nr:TetR family transcriptional regulator [candidate division Zixibacteria bacterium]